MYVYARDVTAMKTASELSTYMHDAGMAMPVAVAVAVAVAESLCMAVCVHHQPALFPRLVYRRPTRPHLHRVKLLL